MPEAHSLIRRSRQYYSACCWWAIEDEPTGICHVIVNSTQWLERSVLGLPGSVVRVFVTDRLPNSDEEEVGRMLFKQPAATLIFWGDSATSVHLLRTTSRLLSMRQLRVVVIYLSTRERALGQSVRQELRDDECHRLAAAVRNRPNSVFVDLSTKEGVDGEYLVLPLALPLIAGFEPWAGPPDSGIALMLQDAPPPESPLAPLPDLRRALGVRKLVFHAPAAEKRSEPDVETCDLLALDGLGPLAQISDVLVDLARSDGYGYLTRLALSLGKPCLSTWRWPRQLIDHKLVRTMTIPGDYDDDLLKEKAADVKRMAEAPSFARELAALAADYADLSASQWARVIRRQDESDQ
jgi:hypothetical protein